MSSTAAASKVLLLLTNEAFIPHKSRWDEEELMKQLNIEAHNPRRHVKSFTGVDIYELAYLWIALTKRAGVEVDLVSPWGGAVPSDPDSLHRLVKDEGLLKEIRDVNDFITMIDHTLPIQAVHPNQYKAVVAIGSYGSMFDLPQCEAVQRVLMNVHENGGYLCTIGHGAAVLANLREFEGQALSGRYLIHEKQIACPTNREEKEKRVEKILPFLLEDRLRERGARVQESEPFKANVVVDERLITAQNAASIRDFIRKIGEKAFKKSIEI